MTDGNYGEARSRYFHSRLSSSDSIEMSSAFLDSNVRKAAAAARRRVSLREKQKLAAVIHLCGPAKGPAMVRSGFDEAAMGSCGAQPVAPYVRRVMRYRAQFSRMAGPG